MNTTQSIVLCLADDSRFTRAECSMMPATLDEGDIQHNHLDAAKVLGVVKAAYSFVLAVGQPHEEALSGTMLLAGSVFMHVEYRKGTWAELCRMCPP